MRLDLSFKRRDSFAKFPYLSSIIEDELVLIGLYFQNIQIDHL